MKEIYQKVLGLLDESQRRRLYLLFGGVLATALIQVLGIVSILPFLAVVSSPDSIHTNEWLSTAYDIVGFQSDYGFLTALGVVVLLFLVFSNLAMAATTWLLLRFTWRQSHELSANLLEKYLRQPYSFFLTHNSEDMRVAVLSEVSQVVGGVMIPGVRALSNGVVAVAIGILVIAVDPTLALIAGLVLGGAYTLVWFLAKRKLTEIGQERLESNRERYRHAGTAFGNVKTVKVFGREEFFIQSFSSSSLRFSLSQASRQAISQLPRYALEIVAFGGILVIVLYLLATRGDIQDIIPLLGLYAYAGYRLMPALQRVFSSVSGVRYNLPALDKIVDELRAEMGLNETTGATVSTPDGLSPLSEAIEMRDITFSYPESDEIVLDELTIEIPAKASVGLVGSTGAGKTTVVDILLGLLVPDSGEIVVDGRALTSDDLPAWRERIGYVPQGIELIDDTLTRNIAFGIPEEEIDLDVVRRSARIARIGDFIEGLPEGYETRVGDKGVRLSGGQSQRIGIARALYHDPELLVFDEATSALDGITENAIIEAIQDLAGSRTIVMIAHRLTTVRDCDKIYLLERGAVEEVGTFDQLMEASSQFREMARASSSTA